MSLNFFFLKNKKNYYSFPPLIAVLEGFPDIQYQFVSEEFIKNYNGNTKKSIDVFCFSYTSLAFAKWFPYLNSVIPSLKEKRAFLIAGGPHATACPEDFSSLGFDVVVKGDGEPAFKEIVKLMFNKIKPHGLFEKRVSSLDDYPPFPNKKEFYKPIEITRGCPHSCNYCQTSFLFSKRPLHRSIENIVFYVKRAFAWGIRDFRFISPNALGYGTCSNKPDIVKLTELLTNIKAVINDEGRLFFGSFPSEIRPEFATAEAMMLIKKFADNKRVIIGAQSLSEKMLKLSKRGHSLEDIEKAIETTLSAGLQPDIDIILGMPGEGEEDLEKTISFIKNSKKNKVRFHLHYFIPLPGTPWQDKKPTPIPDYAIKEFKSLTGAGRVWGHWLAQKSYTKL